MLVILSIGSMVEAREMTHEEAREREQNVVYGGD